MDKQVRLIDFKEEAMPEPIVKIVRNVSMSAGAIIKEETIHKTWIIPRIAN